MSCSPFDLRDYFLQELSGQESKQVELHVRGCGACREELERLQLTEAALFSMREEEIPQRIAFVSDKIFEPSPWRRAWTTFWGSTARLGFASAAMLSTALLVFALTRPAPAPGTAVATPAAAVSEAQVQHQIQAAVDQAVSAAETRQAEKFAQTVADVRRQDLAERRRLMLAADAELGYMMRTNLQAARAGYEMPRASNGGLQ